MPPLTETTEPREDYPRVSVDSLNDWYRLKDSLASAVISILEAKIAKQNSVNYGDGLLRHTKEVFHKAHR